jgi:phage-related protein
MFMQIVTQIIGRVTALFSQAYEWTKTQLSMLVSSSLAKFTQAFQSVRNLHLLNLLRVQTGLSTNHLIVNLITAEQSIKAALMYVRVRLTLLGQQLLTIALPILQRVSQCLQQTNDKLAALTKLAQSRLSAIGCAQTPMAQRLIQGGEKLVGLVSQLRQRVTQLLKAKP